MSTSTVATSGLKVRANLHTINLKADKTTGTIYKLLVMESAS